MLADFLFRLRALFCRRTVESEMDEELRFHFERQAEKYRESGMLPEEAMRQARLDFGGLEQAREECRDARGTRLLDSLAQDVRYGLRLLRRSPAFTVVTILTLALGIGANTAIFSMIDAAFLDELPYPHADQLVMVWEDVHLPNYRNSENTPAPGNFTDWNKQNSVFSEMAAIGYRSWNLAGAGEPVRVEGEAFSADVFSVLQIYPVLGRAFTAEEDRPGASHVALLGYGLWMSRFGADRSIIGRTIQLDEESYQVIGVMPRGFRFPDPDDQLYVPLALTPLQLANHGSHYLRVVARLRPGVTLAQAQSEMEIIARRLTEQYPESNTGTGVRVVLLRDQFAGGVRRPLLLLSGVVGLLLLMVCANVANLMFARASVRAREFAVRTALGAGRARLVRQLLVESVLLSSFGGALGLAFAFWGIDALRAYAPANQALMGTGLNGTVCAFTAVVSLLSGVIFGLAPAFRSSRWEPGGVLQEGARHSPPHAHLRTHGFLIVSEMALGVVVLAATGLLLRSFVHLQEIPLGFQPQNVLTFRVILRGPRYAAPAQQAALYRQAVERIGALPGVESVGGISFLPLTLQGRTAGFSREGEAPSAPGQLPFADFRSVSPGYFATMRIPILQGRDFSWNDAPESPLVVVISQTMARKFWPNGDALGRRIKLGAPTEAVPWMTIVGIVADTRQLELAREPRPAMYFPATQDPGTGDILRDWVVRSSDASTLAPAVRETFSSIDPSLPVSRVQTMEQVLSTYLGPQRFELSLVGLFGIAGLILAAVGLYGVTAYSVARRTHEIGIRMALGAGRGAVIRMIVGQGARLAIVGVAVGLGAALALLHLISSQLYGVSAHDPVTFAGVAILLMLVTLVACYIPARRAIRLDPMAALRHE